MSRTIVETLNGYSIATKRVDVTQTDPKDGQQLYDGLGLPKIESITVVAAISPGRDHIVEIPLAEDGRRALIEALTGGITIPELAVKP